MILQIYIRQKQFVQRLNKETGWCERNLRTKDKKCRRKGLVDTYVSHISETEGWSGHRRCNWNTSTVPRKKRQQHTVKRTRTLRRKDWHSDTDIVLRYREAYDEIERCLLMMQKCHQASGMTSLTRAAGRCPTPLVNSRLQWMDLRGCQWRMNKRASWAQDCCLQQAEVAWYTPPTLKLMTSSSYVSGNVTMFDSSTVDIHHSSGVMGNWWIEIHHGTNLPVKMWSWKWTGYQCRATEAILGNEGWSRSSESEKKYLWLGTLKNEPRPTSIT